MEHFSHKLLISFSPSMGVKHPAHLFASIHLVITPTGSEYNNQIYPKKRNTAMHVCT
jgi:hypothetical protein